MKHLVFALSLFFAGPVYNQVIEFNGWAKCCGDQPCRIPTPFSSPLESKWWHYKVTAKRTFGKHVSAKYAEVVSYHYAAGSSSLFSYTW